MADAETSRLCVQIVRSHFGPLTANVASALLTRGRLSLAQLIRYTMIKPRTVRAAILVMVQHNILWHSNTEEEGEMLEFHTLECLMRLRFGRFVWQAEQLFGPSGAEIVQLILDHGKLQPPDIISRLSIHNPKSREIFSALWSLLMAHPGSSLYSQTLYKLISGAYLKPSTLLSHHSPRDKRIKYEAEEKAKITGFPTAKELREAQETAEARLKREEEEAESVGLKRKPKDLIGHRSSKKKAIEEDMVDDGVYFRVNFDKFNTYIRNKLIEMAAGERFNRSAALVMRATLKATEVRQKSVSDARSDPTSTAAIAILISDDDDLSTGLVTSTKKASSASLVKDYLGLMSAVDNPTPAGKAASFISLIDNKVYVEFGIVSKRLRRRVLEAVARERHGDDGVRIVRLLLDIGKMDEKQIAKVAMMPNNVVRPLLAALSSDFLISTQEVPRSADRNPTRTFYLWHVDLHKAYSALLGHLYKTLYNIGMRRQAEQEEPTVKAVLEKRARTDVAQDENLLSRMERDVLKEWETKQEKLTVLEMRVEEAVFILRDLDKVGSHEDI
ncbi:RNA polymerase III subunit RPC82-domain-containing protein [Suillus subalutaceus]|uniref:RNA polymerase III subunit RPC82-domain-containing protein n=1 Tax=Suillus subalutaceus TaxID=48586 RepID=UPI001B867937|nr:RNA polymerase III subunit RPC82-domain-containing protein [Suillus subalutaceus]KAG1858366.1 RNA polymerase III subunit RPC82-domain-containing protein [Suillus subalutaceus]